MNLDLFVRKVCADGNERHGAGDQARRKPLALMKTDHCLWIFVCMCVYLGGGEGGRGRGR